MELSQTLTRDSPGRQAGTSQHIHWAQLPSGWLASERTQPAPTGRSPRETSASHRASMWRVQSVHPTPLHGTATSGLEPSAQSRACPAKPPGATGEGPSPPVGPGPTPAGAQEAAAPTASMLTGLGPGLTWTEVNTCRGNGPPPTHAEARFSACVTKCFGGHRE